MFQELWGRVIDFNAEELDRWLHSNNFSKFGTFLSHIDSLTPEILFPVRSLQNNQETALFIDEASQRSSVPELLEQFNQKTEHQKQSTDLETEQLKQLTNLAKAFDKSLDDIAKLAEQTLKKGHKKQLQKVTEDLKVLRDQSRVFFALHKPGVQDTEQFKNQVELGMSQIGAIFGAHRGWHGINKTVRALLGALAALFILPALIVQATTPGFSYTFFSTETKTKSHQKLQEIKGDVNQVVDKLSNDPNQEDEQSKNSKNRH